MQKEYAFVCPSCWEEITILLDMSQHHQEYIEDCEVCCHPIQISYQVEDEEIINFEADKAQE